MRSKIQTIVIAVILFPAMVFIVSSCSKKENQAPVVSITEPSDNQMFSIPDSVIITGTVTDDESLHEMSLVIVKATGDTIAKVFPYVHELKTYNFNYEFRPSDAGTYSIQVTAEDHTEKSTTVSRTIMVM